MLRNQITPMTAIMLLMWLEIFESLSLFGPITFIIDSCSGGNWIAAKHMYASLKHTRPPVIGIAKNFVNSAALAVFAGADDRLVHAGTHFSFHTAASELSEKDAIDSRGNLVRIKSVRERETAAFYARISRETRAVDEEFYEILTDGFGFPHSYIARMLCEEERAFFVDETTATEIMRLGIAHSIIPRSKKRALSKKKR